MCEDAVLKSMFCHTERKMPCKQPITPASQRAGTRSIAWRDRRRRHAAVVGQGGEEGHLEPKVPCVHRGEEEGDHDRWVHERQGAALQNAELTALGCCGPGRDERPGYHGAEDPEGVNGGRDVGLAHGTRRARDARVHRTRARRGAPARASEGLVLHGWLQTGERRDGTGTRAMQATSPR